MENLLDKKVVTLGFIFKKTKGPWFNISLLEYNNFIFKSAMEKQRVSFTAQDNY